MTELISLLETIGACDSLDSLQAILSELELRCDLSKPDERVLRKHLQMAASRLLREERLKLTGTFCSEQKG